MDLDLSNAIHRQIFMGCFGRQMTVWTRDLLAPGDLFLDVGAHIGYFTLLAATRVHAQGQVIAIEPNPAAFRSLQKHLQNNGIANVMALPCALSSHEGTLRLFAPPSTEQRDYNVTYLQRPGWDYLDVEAKTLDACCMEWKVKRVRLMKMDVEGAEPKVLQGGQIVLREGRIQHLVCEVNGPRLTEGGYTPAQLIEQLDDLGFFPAIMKSGRAVPIAASRLDLHPGHEHDRLFVHRTVQ